MPVPTTAILGDGQVRRGDLPGDFAIWVFIFAELAVFGIFFAAYALVRARHVELFNASQATLDRGAGAINTLALITSSYCVARAVAAIREGAQSGCVRWLGGAILLGLVFIVVKTLEYAVKFDAGVTLSSNLFYMFYLSLTFFHFMHVILGLVILAAVLVKTRRGAYSRSAHAGVESAASYWHMVDLVWIVLFVLVYVMH